MVWRQLIELTLSFDYDVWLDNNLLLCKTWKEARQMFVKKFESALQALESRRAVATMRMYDTENVTSYTLRFSRAAQEAGHSRYDTTIATIFLCGFPVEWQTQINTILCSQGRGISTWTVDEISAAASNVYGDRTRGGYNASTSASTVVSNSPFASGNAKGKRKADGAILSAALGPINGMNKRRGSFFCPRHGGNASSPLLPKDGSFSRLEAELGYIWYYHRRRHNHRTEHWTLYGYWICGFKCTTSSQQRKQIPRVKSQTVLGCESESEVFHATWQNMPTWCRYCHKEGHTELDCPLSKARIICYSCHQQGHRSFECPRRRNVRTNLHNQTSNQETQQENIAINTITIESEDESNASIICPTQGVKICLV
jgi:hypothetical protein